MEIYAVKINGLDHPMGFDFEHLLCSWKVRNNKGKKQTRAKIQVGKDEKMSEVIWEKEGGLNSLGYDYRVFHETVYTLLFSDYGT